MVFVPQNVCFKEEKRAPQFETYPHVYCPKTCQNNVVRTPDPSQVGVEKVNIIGWVDLTKNGVLGQKEVNRVGLWCEKLIAKNLTGCSADLSEEFGLLLMPSHPSFSLVGT